MPDFKIVADFEPTGDQPQAIDALSKGLQDGLKHQTLLGVTGSGKTFTMAQIVKELDEAGDVARTVELEVNIRYLFPSEVHVMLEQAGLVAEHVYGDFHGAPLDEDSEEMVWVVRRAGE